MKVTWRATDLQISASDEIEILRGARARAIHGYVKNIEMLRNSINFELEEKAPPIVSGVLRECAKFIAPKLY